MAGQYVALKSRAIITLTGDDRAEFLQGLISNDIKKCAADRALWAAFLTPQGKYLHDFFITDANGFFWLDCEADRMMDLGQRLRRYKLRSQVDLNIGRDLCVFALLDVAPETLGLSGERGHCVRFADGVAFVDPRQAEIGVRVIATETSAKPIFDEMGLTEAALPDYEQRRLEIGLPDGSRDMEPEKATLLENGFDELGGVDWQKGCYMGQELTARTKYRGLVKKRLLPVRTVDGSELSANMAVLCADKEIGQVKSSAGDRGLALVRLDRWRDADADGERLTVGDAIIAVEVPSWVNLAANTKSDQS